MENTQFKKYQFCELIISINGIYEKVSPHVKLWIPKDGPEYNDGDMILVEPINNYNYSSKDWNKVFKNHLIIPFFDKVPMRGKAKWVLIESGYNKKQINDCPTVVSCSLNCHEPPIKRNWFKHPNCDLNKNLERSKIPWEEAMQFCFIELNFLPGLQYIILVLYARLHLLSKGSDFKDFESTKKLISDLIRVNPSIKLDEKYLEEKHINFLRDIGQLW